MANMALILLLIVSFLPLSKEKAEILEDKILNLNISKELNLEQKEEKDSMIVLDKPFYKVGESQFVSGGEAIKVVDLKTGQTIYQKNSDKKMQIGSLTKLMTTILAYENLRLDEVVAVPALSSQPGEAIMGLKKDEKIKAGELIQATLIHSAGDAAHTLAVSIAGSEKEFAKLMNKRASEFQLKNTNFENSIGFDSKENFSTADDLLNLTRIFLQDEYFRKIVSRREYVASNEAGRKYFLQNTNRLLDNKNIYGVKTGYTYGAGECLIALSKNNEREILTIVLNNPSRFDETTRLINWFSEAFKL